MNLRLIPATILVVLPVLFLASGCATVRDVPFPSDWPTRVSGSQCTSVSGHYENTAIASTPKEPRGNPLPTHGFLASLLQRGSPDNYDADQLRISSVELDVTSTEFVAHYASGSVGIRKPMRADWKCVPTGELELRKTESIGCEACLPATVERRITLGAAVDGSLIMHVTHEWKSFYSRRDNRVEAWARYRRLP